jgi:hypothetical protein
MAALIIGQKISCSSHSKLTALSGRLGTRIAALLEPERMLKRVLQICFPRINAGAQQFVPANTVAPRDNDRQRKG